MYVCLCFCVSVLCEREKDEREKSIEYPLTRMYMICVQSLPLFWLDYLLVADEKKIRPRELARLDRRGGGFANTIWSIIAQSLL